VYNTNNKPIRITKGEHTSRFEYGPGRERFLQADNTQSYNRCSYLWNNPLNATDPSGFLLKKLWDNIRPVVGAIVAAVLCYAANCLGSTEAMIWIGGVSGAVGAAANGADTSGIMLGAMTGMASGANIYLGAIVAGVSAHAQGGSFGRTFAAAGVGAMVSGLGLQDPQGFITASVVGGVSSEITGGKFKNGAATAAFTWALSQGAQRAQAARENRGGEWILPEGGSTDMNDYDTVMTNGILGDREAFVLSVNKEQIPGYFNPSGGALAADIGESFRQKFFGWAGDPLAKGFAEGLAGVDHPMRIVAHSQGTLTVANAARYYGLPEGSTLVMRSPAISRWRANAAANSIGGSMQYVQPYGDIANIYAPSLNPVRWLSGFGDAFCGACTHTANGLP